MTGEMVPYGMGGGEADVFKQLTKVTSRDRQNIDGHILKTIYDGFSPFFSEPMSAGNLTKERQEGQILRAQFAAASTLKSIEKIRYQQTTLALIMGAYANAVTKISQSAEGPGNLVQKLKTAWSISQATTRHDESLKASGKVK